MKEIIKKMIDHPIKTALLIGATVDAAIKIVSIIESYRSSVSKNKITK